MGVFFAGLVLAAGVQEPIDTARAARYFAEAKVASDDMADVWGRSLYGPTMFVDRRTRFAVTNQTDREGKLTRQGDVWVGQVPQALGVANTAAEWAGVRWTMVVWPVPSDLAERNQLLLHESFHRVQDELGLPSGGGGNAHLDTKEGRIWLRLEWRALSRALISWGPERRESLADALAFRARRRSIFPKAAAEEDRMEVHEGLAEYTGIRAMGLGDWGRRSYVSGRLKINARKPSYSYAFAYETGPAYGLLLDMDVPDWREKVNPQSSLSEMLQAALKLPLPRDVQRRIGSYGGGEVIREEEKRERERLARVAAYRRLLVDGPVLELPMRGANFTFDPNSLAPLGAEGTAYPTLTVSDAWGVLEAQKGARINATYSALFVSAPTAADRLAGDGWKLTLRPGWRVVAGSRKGDWKLTQD